MTRKTPRARRNHTFFFKKKAVQRALSDAETVDGVARDIDVVDGLLRRWMRAYQHHGDAGLKSKRSGRRQIPTPADACPKTASPEAGGFVCTDEILPAHEPRQMTRSSVKPEQAPEASVAAKLYAIIGRLIVENQDLREQIERR